MLEGACRRDMAILVLFGADPAPLSLCGRGYWACLNTRVHAGDQVQLPEQPLNLPGSQCSKDECQDQHGTDENTPGAA